MVVGQEFQGEFAEIAPWNSRGESNVQNARQVADLPHRFAVIVHYLSGRFFVADHRHVYGENVARLKSGADRLEREQSIDRRRGCCHEYEARCHLYQNENFQPAVGGARNSQAPGGQPESLGNPRRRQPRDECQQGCGENSQSSTHPEHARINGEIERANREPGCVLRKDSHERPGYENAQGRACDAQQQALGQQKTAQVECAGSERCAHGEFIFPAHSARQNQIRDIRTGDDEDQHRCGHEHKQYGPCSGSKLVAQSRRADLKVPPGWISFRMLPLHALVHGIQLCASFVQSGTRFQAPKQFSHAMDSPGDHRRRKMMSAGDDVANDLGVLRIRNTRLQNADDRSVARINE